MREFFRFIDDEGIPMGLFLLFIVLPCFYFLIGFIISLFLGHWPDGL